VWKSIPSPARDYIRQNRIRVLALDAVRVAQEVASQPQLAQRMQGIVLLGSFLRVAPFVAARGLSDAEVYAAVEKSLRKFFGKRGEKVVQENLTAVRRGRNEAFEIPPEMMTAAGEMISVQGSRVQSSRSEDACTHGLLKQERRTPYE